MIATAGRDMNIELRIGSHHGLHKRLSRLAVLATAALLLSHSASAANPNWCLKAEIDGEFVEGSPVFWSSQEVQLLGRDGRLRSFSPGKAKNYAKSSTRFTSYSPAQVRGLLLRELGDQFDISGTGQYLVAYPRGEKNEWAKRFEDLYRSFLGYFRVRGLQPADPQFPLVAIVWPTQLDFLRYARKDGANVSRNVLGYYSPVSNRIALYDITRGDPKSPDWQENAETIIHEATHQTAYNTGIHTRFGQTPKWVVEGLATMFEARGVYDSASYRDQKSRINQARLQQFQEYASGRRKPGALSELIGSDRIFAKDIDAAYAESWALTFYLAETRDQNYAKYLRLTAKRGENGIYPSAQRVADFTKVFGDDLRLFEAQFLAYMNRLK